MKKIISILLIVTLMFSITGCSGNEPTNTQPTELNKPEELVEPEQFTQPIISDEIAEFEEPVEPEQFTQAITPNEIAATWKEVPIKDATDVRTKVSSSRAFFDLRSLIKGENSGDGYIFNTFVFSGTIINLKEFQISWTDDEGEEWGPFSRSIIEVRVDKEYNGKTPVEGDVIRVLYPFSLSWDFDNSVRIKENGKYVFANCWVLDETYSHYNEKYNPVAVNDGSADYADVIMGSAWNSLLPIEDERVIFYHGYFEHDEEAKLKFLHHDSFKTDMLTSDSSLETGDYTMMNIKDFENEFSKLFEKQDALPTAAINLFS
ncbi:MAG: hypothetical protein FWG70_04295 [Oscillospiraceae bacterium]|nr:hypothetical protein [Oscillospiraceae bacterium]